MIKLNRINKYFNKRKSNQIHVINEISLDFEDKGLVVLLGASGSGKTTLLNVIGGLDKVDSGSLVFEHDDISKYKAGVWDKIRNKSIGYIFQNYNLLPKLSVYENIAFVLKMLGINDESEIEKSVSYVLNAVNMYPYRYKKSLQLSGGQQQRVAIARALVKNPKVIIADEPTGNLDSKNTLDVMNIIKSISKEKLVILVTHDKELAKYYGDRIIEIVDGAVVNDYINNEEASLLYDDNTIYLKDIKNHESFDALNRKIDIYSEEEKPEEVTIRLISKDDTLYLDINTAYKNIQILDENSNIKLKDEHYVEKTKDETTHTHYNGNDLAIEIASKTKKQLFSTKSSILLALSMLFSGKFRTLLMISTFIISGVLLAFAVSICYAKIDVNLENVKTRSDDYVVLTVNKKYSYNVLKLLVGDDLNINLYTTANLGYNVPEIISKHHSQMYITMQIDIIDNLSSGDLVMGRMPENENEIVISFSQAKRSLSTVSSINSTSGVHPNSYGIWNVEDLLGEHFLINGMRGIDGKSEFRIVGFSDDRHIGLFVSRRVANRISIGDYIYDPLTGKTVPIDNLTQDQINDRLMSNYNDRTYNDKIFYYLYNIDRDVLKEKLEKEDTISIMDINDYYKSAIGDDPSANITLIVSLALALVTTLGYYFIIRSSMTSRVYEISVYRALGVGRFQIARSFLIEIIIITTVSTLIGYIVGSVIMHFAVDSLFSMLGVFRISWLSAILGGVFVYAVNILFGMLPLFGLLRKTPAQILSKYDI